MNKPSAEDYQTAVAALAPNSGVSEEARSIALQIKQAFEDPDPTAPLVNPQAPAQTPPPQLDPSMPLLPQALAVSPATTDPAGDDAAKDKWLIDGGKGAKGTVIYYEPTLSLAKKDLLEHPEYALSLDHTGQTVIDPEMVANLKKDDPLFDTYKDLKWREAAAAAAKAGKTAYRYSQAPYLHGDGAASTLNTLGLKAIGSVEPGLSAVTSFIGGVDNAAAFGAGNRVANLTDAAPDKPAVDNPNAPFEFQGGTAAAQSPSEYRSLSADEHPLARWGGQALGALSHWAPSNMLFAQATGMGARAAAGLGGGLAARTGMAALSAGAAGVADQGIREGVNAGADLAEHGETPITLGGAAGNLGTTGLLAGGIGGLSEGLLGVPGKMADTIATHPHFGGLPGRLERAGYEFGVGGPKLSPETQSLVKVANMSGAQPGDVIAKEIAPGVIKAADDEVKGAIQTVTAKKEAFYQTPEGRQEIPSQNFVERGLGILRSKHDLVGGELRPTEVSGTIPSVQKVWNNEIARVSTEPVPGAPALSPEEAEAFLTPARKRDLEPKSTDSETLFHERYRTDDPSKTKEGLAANLRRRGIDKVYVVPRVHDARSADHALDGLGVFGSESGEMKGTAEYHQLDQAMRLDRDVRPGAGAPGGWSAMQAEHAQLLDAAKKLERLAAPNGESFRALASYGTPKQGELLSVEALRKAADKAGVREQLESIRHLPEALRLKAAASYGPSVNGGGRSGVFSPSAHFDAATMAAFPWLRKLGGTSAELLYGPVSPLGAQGPVRSVIGRGMAGTVGAVTSDEHSKE